MEQNDKMVSVLGKETMNTEEKFIYLGITLLIVAVALFLFSAPSSAAYSGQSSGTTTGFTTVNSDACWADGDQISSVWGSSAGQFHEGASGQQLVAGPGRTDIDISSSMSSDYSKQTDLYSSAQYAIWDTLYSKTLIPNESEIECSASELVYTGAETITTGATPDEEQIVGQTGAMGTGRYRSAQYNDGSVFAQSAIYAGNGTSYGDMSASARSGTDKDSDTLQYENWIREHNLWTGEQTASKIEWTWNDFSDPFNQTANETVADEEVTNTSEEAES